MAGVTVGRGRPGRLSGRDGPHDGPTTGAPASRDRGAGGRRRGRRPRGRDAMSPRVVLARAMAAGLALRLDDQGAVRLTGRATPNLLADLRAHKAAIAELL